MKPLIRLPKVALIPAAGQGKRIRQFTQDPKILLNIGGLSLLERHLRGLTKIGVERFVLVIGYKANKIKKYIKGKKLDKTYDIRLIENKQYKVTEDGISIYLAKNEVKEKFFLVMGDHIIYYRILKAKSLIPKVTKKKPIISVIDTKPKYMKPDWSMRVKVKGSALERSSKTLKVFDGVDIGCFICHPSVFSLLEDNIKNGLTLWNDTVVKCIENLRVGVFDIKGGFWFNLNSFEQYNYCKKAILKSLSKRDDGIVSLYFNRKVSTNISKWIVNFNLSPNLLSFVCLSFAILASIFFIFGTRSSILIGGILTQIWSILDGVDGEVARLKLMESKYGDWLDQNLDRLSNTFVMLGLGYGCYKYTQDFSYYFIVSLAYASMMLFFFRSVVSRSLFMDKEKYLSENYYKISINEIWTNATQLLLISLSAIGFFFEPRILFYSMIFLAVTNLLFFGVEGLKKWLKYGNYKGVEPN